MRRPHVPGLSMGLSIRVSFRVSIRVSTETGDVALGFGLGVWRSGFRRWVQGLGSDICGLWFKV